MYFDTNFGIKDLFIFTIVLGVMLLITETKILNIQHSIYTGPHRYIAVVSFAIIFTLLNHIKFS